MHACHRLDRLETSLLGGLDLLDEEPDRLVELGHVESRAAEHQARRVDVRREESSVPALECAQGALRDTDAQHRVLEARLCQRGDVELGRSRPLGELDRGLHVLAGLPQAEHDRQGVRHRQVKRGAELV